MDKDTLSKTMKKVKVIIFFAAGFILLGIAGTIDRTEQTLYVMPDSVYNEIKEKLSSHGNRPTDYEITTYYHKHYGSAKK